MRGGESIMANTGASSLENELRAIVADIAEVDVDKITLGANFVEDLGMDSMMALEILACIEKKYKLRIPEENLTKIVTLDHVVKLVEQFMKK